MLCQTPPWFGVHFKPAGASPFAVWPVHELTEQVVDLETLWGQDALHLRDQLIEAKRPHAKFQNPGMFFPQAFVPARSPATTGESEPWPQSNSSWRILINLPSALWPTKRASVTNILSMSFVGK